MKRCPKCFGSIRRMGRIEKPFYCPKCKEWFSNEEVTPKQTNADRIRAASDEELARFMNHGACPPGEDVSELCYNEDGGSVADMCTLCWLKWLRQEGE